MENTITYRYNNEQLIEMPYYLYEFSYYELFKNGCRSIDSKFIKSNKPLNISDYSKINSKVVRFVSLLGAPLSYIKELKLPIFKLKKK
jgi:hypothetical protein